MSLKDDISFKKIPTLGRKVKNANILLENIFKKPVISSQLVKNFV